MRILLLGLALLLGAVPLHAWQIDELQVSHSGGDYRVRLRARLSAPPERVYAQLADLSALAQINPALREVQLGATDADGRLPLTTTSEFCVLAMCRSLRHGQRVRLLPAAPGGRIESETLPPPASDFREGAAVWQVQAQDEGSLLLFEARLTPDFWLPPVIGPWAVERRLRDESRIAVERLERLGQGLPPS